MVNDGSTNDTAKKAAELQSALPGQVIISKQENRGLASARQAGLEKTRGDFLVLLDADDMLYPNMIDICGYIDEGFATGWGRGIGKTHPGRWEDPAGHSASTSAFVMAGGNGVQPNRCMQCSHAAKVIRGTGRWTLCRTVPCLQRLGSVDPNDPAKHENRGNWRMHHDLPPA